ncbi:hypothetical protein [Bosea sp. (in: a-proteobacteria)]|uniref:hypothetical protein n=1 Tax=Bosea sp. (in: a-proteobacteria) TaxID=1871050 RepID=UPI001AC2BB2F|nr:hypothetical protein [Bosea sp. (in: a-proteobacteria)]MBN9441145.1 hypothetical protein [Bosea sp. (in: a-proteobacteria)]
MIATQDWTHSLTIMQQSVLLSAIRGCDGMPKLHKAKPLVRWYRRCVLISAFDGVALDTPFSPGGGSFTGPLLHSDGSLLSGPMFEALPSSLQHQMRCDTLQRVSDDFVDSRDEIPAHYLWHFIHAIEIVGYKHPIPQIREFWGDLYVRLVRAFHVYPETEAQMDERLGDNEAGWLRHSDESTHCTD